MGKILYLECYSGISGDMMAGALLDLGASKEVLIQALNSLSLTGYRLHFGRTQKCGIDAYDFDVHLEDENGGHESGEAHLHRNITDIREIISRLDADKTVKELAERIFQIIAEAEAKAHGILVEEVHFHEVGAVDSIIDIVAAAVCLHDLKIEQVILSPLAEGRGYAKCQHGRMPVPVPATAHIAAEYGLKLQLTENEGEMVTPTGAAIAAAIKTGASLPKHYTIQKIGTGAGNKEFQNPNILRAMLIEPIKEPAEAESDSMWVLETNIDDCGGEALGFTMECLYQAGAKDVWYTPVYMKKNRPSYLLSVLCGLSDVKTLEDLIFTQTTTIGLRKYPVTRTVLQRSFRTAVTKYGDIKVKVCKNQDRLYYYPEYEDICKICRDQDLDYQSVYQEAVLAAQAADQQV